MSRVAAQFGTLVGAQAAHSAEEYVGRLWENFPPAAYLTALVSSDRELGFLVINISLVAFGVWCFQWPVRRAWRSGVPLMWFWVILEATNGIGHSAWSLLQRGYTPGVATAPLLFGLSAYLAVNLAMRHRASVG